MYGVVTGEVDQFGQPEEDAVVVALAGDPLYVGVKLLDQEFKLADVRLLAPVLPRSKVVGIGRNYAAHAAELGNEVPSEPMMFLKPNTSVVGPGDPVFYPPQTQDLQYEGELAVVIGRNYAAHAAELGNEVPKVPLIFFKPNTAVIGPEESIIGPAASQEVAFEGELAVVIGRICRDVPPEQATDVIFGYTIGNDVTARDLQKKDGRFARAKGFDTFCPIGPAIRVGADLEDLEVVTRVNGTERQRGHTRMMAFQIADLLAYVSRMMTLEPGDVLLTGTPAGVGPLADGDQVEVEVSGVGVLANPVEGWRG
jgi:2-keto-4-pentenoate hydratase/2-oxohepta-3-ene-1,7-dioic acid hydratase in catechol pathway